MTIVYHGEQLPLFPTKKCRICHEEKPLEDFHRDKAKKDGYRSECRVCALIRHKQYYTDHAEEQRAYQKRYASEHAEYTKQYALDYRPKKNAKDRKRYASDPEYKARRQQRSKEGHQKEDPELRRNRLRRYRATHRSQFAEYTMKYRARKLGAETEDTVDYEMILKRDGYHCYICGKDIDPLTKGRTALAFDHEIPLIRLGPHIESNIHPTHVCCNSRKHDKLLSELTDWDRRGP